MSEEKRRSLPRAGGGETPARPAMRSEVMAALHARPRPMLRHPVEIDEVKRLLQPRDYGVWSTMLALAEYGLVHLFPADERYATPASVCLTTAGRLWKPATIPDLEPWAEEHMRYVYRQEGLINVGTLADVAKCWENAQYYGPPGPEPVLLTWLNRDPGYQLHVDRLTPLDQVAAEGDWITYRLWAAGEQVQVRIDGRN